MLKLKNYDGDNITVEDGKVKELNGNPFAIANEIADVFNTIENGSEEEKNLLKGRLLPITFDGKKATFCVSPFADGDIDEDEFIKNISELLGLKGYFAAEWSSLNNYGLCVDVRSCPVVVTVDVKCSDGIEFSLPFNYLYNNVNGVLPFLRSWRMGHDYDNASFYRGKRELTVDTDYCEIKVKVSKEDYSGFSRTGLLDDAQKILTLGVECEMMEG